MPEDDNTYRMPDERTDDGVRGSKRTLEDSSDNKTILKADPVYSFLNSLGFDAGIQKDLVETILNLEEGYEIEEDDNDSPMVESGSAEQEPLQEPQIVPASEPTEPVTPTEFTGDMSKESKAQAGELRRSDAALAGSEDDQGSQDASAFLSWLNTLPPAKGQEASEEHPTDPGTVDPASTQKVVSGVESHDAAQDREATSKPEAPPSAEALVQKKKKNKKKRKKKKKKKKAREAKALAETLADLDEDIASETLATLLVSMGHTDEAIKMYDRLRLKYPEKSRFFAAKIEDLKKKS